MEWAIHIVVCGIDLDDDPFGGVAVTTDDDLRAQLALALDAAHRDDLIVRLRDGADDLIGPRELAEVFDDLLATDDHRISDRVRMALAVERGLLEDRLRESAA